jgi:hypothetical protein
VFRHPSTAIPAAGRIASRAAVAGRSAPAPWPLALFLGLACLPAVPAGAKSISLDSAVRTSPITIDAKLDDWQDALVYVKQANLAVGLLNDGTDLYLCVQSRDPEVNLQILEQGMTAWLTPHGASEKQFGIEFPLARDRVESYSRMATATGTQGGGGGQGRMTRLAIRGAGPDDRRVMAIADATGIAASAASIDDAFVYEMRIPLVKSPEHPYAVGAAPGDRIEILLETPEPAPYVKEHGDSVPRSGGSGGGAGGAGGGGMGGHGGGGYGGGGGGMGGHGGGHRGGGGGSGGGGRTGGAPSDSAPAGHASPPAPLSLTIKARLAAAPP